MSQYPEVVRNGRLAHVHLFGQIAHAQLSLPDQDLDHVHTRWVAEDFEDLGYPGGILKPGFRVFLDGESMGAPLGQDIPSLLVSRVHEHFGTEA